MNCPTTLPNEAKKFWGSHAPALIRQNILTDETKDNFILLCRTWGYLQTTDPESNHNASVRYVNLSKLYLSLMKQFVGKGEQEKDEFDL